MIAAEKELKNIKHKRCVVCGAEFSITASAADRVTCSKKCSYVLRWDGRKDGVVKVCKTCGKEYEVAKNASDASGYCSKACLYARNKKLTTRKCVVCGTEFSTPPSLMRVVTCSTECGYKHSGGKNKPNYKGHTKLVIVNGKKVRRLVSWAAREHNASRQRAKNGATPSWADRDKIKAIYKDAEAMSVLSGIKYHVDHIVPLKSKLVCGLHCEANLQIITAVENLKKHNLHWPDKP